MIWTHKHLGQIAGLDHHISEPLRWYGYIHASILLHGIPRDCGTPLALRLSLHLLTETEYSSISAWTSLEKSAYSSLEEFSLHLLTKIDCSPSRLRYR